MLKDLAPYFSDLKKDFEKHVKLDLSILFLILLSCVLYIILTYNLPSIWRNSLLVLDFLILSIFVAEFCLRLYFAKSKIDFFLDKYTYFDIIAIFPFFFGLNTQYFRIIRIFRFLRFTHVYLNYSRKSFHLSTENIFLLRIIFSLVCILFISSGLILTIEGNLNPNINQFDDALYFTLVSVTTVGYGDITPITSLGKIVTMLVIICGVVLIPYNIGTLLNHITHNQHYREEECEVCGLYLHEQDAKFCKHCGTKLPSNGKKYRR